MKAIINILYKVKFTVVKLTYKNHKGINYSKRKLFVKCDVKVHEKNRSNTL